MGIILLGVALTCMLLIAGVWFRHAAGDALADAFSLELAMEAIQLGGSVASLIAVTLLAVSMWSNPGTTIEQNLPLGLGQDAVVGLLFVAGIASFWYTTRSYLQSVKPRREKPLASRKQRKRRKQ